MTSPAPLSVQLYSLRNEAAKDFGEVIQRIGEIGFVGVELAGFHGMAVVEVKSRIADAGLQVSSAHIGSVGNDLPKLLDDLAEVGCTTAVLAFLPPAEFADRASISRNAAAINAALPAATQRGMTLGYHNHWWEFQTTVDGKSAWSHLMDELDPAVFVELDMYWATLGGVDPIDLISTQNSRVRLLHVKDGPCDEPENGMVAVGSGTLDVTGILTAPSQIAWHIVELDRCDTDMYEAISGSYTFLTKAGLSTGRSTNK
jgi:sugar phosphate isomerase/epimerase